MTEIIEVIEVFFCELSTLSVAVRLVMATAMGALVGMERAQKRYAAGIRTFALVCLGSALAMVTALYLGEMGSGDAVSFCNELSKKEGLDPVYSINGVTNVYRWGVGNDISEKIEWDEEANGYRLPTLEEWQYAAKGGQEFKYSGSDNLDEVGWYVENSDRKTHPVAQKKPNGYGLYDMSGNVWEWCWDSDPYGSYDRYFCGGSWNYGANYCEVGNGGWLDACSTYNSQGFRIVRSTGK